MTLEEFEKILKKDPDLQKKFDAARNKLSVDAVNDVNKLGTALSQIIRDLGYDVSADECTLDYIHAQSLDENELEAVTGGLGGGCKSAHKAQNKGKKCLYDYVDGENCWFKDSCASVYQDYSHPCPECQKTSSTCRGDK